VPLLGEISALKTAVVVVDLVLPLLGTAFLASSLRATDNLLPDRDSCILGSAPRISNTKPLFPNPHWAVFYGRVKT